MTRNPLARANQLKPNEYPISRPTNNHNYSPYYRYPMVFTKAPGFCALVEHEIKLLPSLVERRLKGPDGKGGVRLAIDYRHIKFKYRPGKHNLVADFLSRMWLVGDRRIWARKRRVLLLKKSC